ncbi:MAG: hypothetical protein IJX38_03075 [Clostridia bacterium]|nr:hypothetical protein [Clostridia bacterium]
MGISENAAYIKGLAEGLELSSESKEGKVITKLLDLVCSMAEKIEELEAQNDELYGYMEEMAEDLVNIEEDLYSDDDDEEFEDYSDLNDEEDYDGEPMEDYYEIECPSCGEKVCFTEDVDIEAINCPACGESFGDVEISDSDEE